MASAGPAEALERRGQARVLSRSLSGYLCGTHSGALGRRRGDRLGVEEACAAHRALRVPAGSATLTLANRWQPGAEAQDLARQLSALLDHRAVVDLLVFGSHAGGAPTGFSDFDAVLVLGDRTAEDPATLSSLRPRVLATQRAVLAHQPMQHHGFELATPALLGDASAALELPREALERAQSLHGNPIRVGFPDAADHAARGLRSIARQLCALPAWPNHPWKLHGTLSMFELLPALFLQSRGVAVSKRDSFDLARAHFSPGVWPYDVLAQVREDWPRRRNRRLELAATAARNPWLAVAGWTRLPSAWPPSVRPLLPTRSLRALQDLARRMAEAAP